MEKTEHQEYFVIGRDCQLSLSTASLEWSENISKPNNRFKLFLESGNLFGFAGLYCSFIDDDGIKKIGFVIASMPTNEHISKVLHRQPKLILKNNIENGSMSPARNLKS
ncbi:hypothetical protein LSS_23255 [Leptospira santarosai serovar Shermani str. LT 821]|uniref:Uncharacterized protein n=1 Tax=Leptospira santarosai serovar Shermani str. LT 821 TaxID=758847 RepID=A0A097ET26_9LEPT|nr:hypothetical protein LSS_23255 [Leptospira santarosai serovar Shermani str. LT 821]